MLTIHKDEYGAPAQFHTTCGHIHGSRFTVKNSLGQIVGRFATNLVAMEYITWHCSCEDCEANREYAMKYWGITRTR